MTVAREQLDHVWASTARLARRRDLGVWLGFLLGFRVEGFSIQIEWSERFEVLDLRLRCRVYYDNPMVLGPTCTISPQASR